MIYNETSYLRVVYNEMLRSVEMHWKTFTLADELKTGLNTGIKLAAEMNLSNWIADVCKLGVIGEEEQKWSNEDWFPRAIQSGVKRMAVIVSDDIFNQMSVDEIMQKAPQINFVSQYFNSLEEARAWIANQN